MGATGKVLINVPDEKKFSLIEKVLMVSMDIRNIEKNMEVGKGNYTYKAVSDIDVTLAVKDAEKKYGLVSVPIKQDLINSDVLKKVDEKGKISFLFVDTIKMTLRIFDLDSDQTMDIESFGKGIDSGDKGFGKASTYARKNALLNAYKIPTGEDLDSEKSQDINTPKEMSEKKVKIINYLEGMNDLKEQVLSHFGVPRLEDLNAKDINTLYTTYKAKKLI